MSATPRSPTSSISRPIRAPLDAVKYDDAFPLWLTQRDSFRAALATGLDIPVKELVTPFAGVLPESREGFSPMPYDEEQPVRGFPKTPAQALAVGLSPAMLPLVAALSAAEAARGPREALVISRFMESEPFFADMDQKTVLSIAKQASLAYFSIGEPIIRQGALGDFLHVMFSGSAYVAVEGVGKITKLSAPCTFGELAMGHNGRRQASVISTTHVFSLCIGRVEFHELVRSFYEIRKVRLTEWFATLPFFTNWSHTRLNKLIARTVVKNLRVGEIVEVEGKKSDDIAFVKRGALAISRIERTDTESRWPESVESTEAAIAAQINIQVAAAAV
jgi:CRP-like cAMP-binding protein